MAQRVRPKQAVEQDVTMETSIQQVNTLLETGVACIAYLRGIFDEDSFEEAQILAPRLPVSSSNPAGSQKAEQKKGETTSVKVKRLLRGRSEEADKLLDFLERGAADAIRQGYLSQLILAIYLDPSQPTNIVEAYTFTFSYETDAQGNKRPEMDVRDKLGNMVISSSSSSGSKKNRIKESDVKRQVQRLIKNLITNTQALDELPRRRYLTMRVFFTEDCPPEYQPPLFHPVDPSQADYSITTSLASEQPEVGTLGAMNTGFHGVTLHTISIAHLLETDYDENITLAECLDRNQREAATRNVVWDAEELVSSITDEDAKIKTLDPVGILDDEGKLRTVEEVQRDEALKDIRLKVGLEVDEEEQVVTSKGEADMAVKSTNLSDNEALQQALASTIEQASSQVPATQPAPIVSRQKSFRPPVPLFDEAPEAYAERSAQAAAMQLSQHSPTDIDGERLSTVDEDAEMEDGTAEQQGGGAEAPAQAEVGPSIQSIVQERAAAQGFPISSMNAFEVAEDETQLIDYTQHVGASPALPESAQRQPSGLITPPPAQPADKARKVSLSGHRQEGCCECGDSREDGDMIECSNCDVYKHCCCYGYDGAADKRIPEEFVCYPCRVDIGPVEALLNPERMPEISGALDDLRSLALFRRAIDTVWKDGVLDQGQLSARLAIDPSTAAQLITRLRDERFIVERAPPKGKGKSQARKKPQVSISRSAPQKRLKNETYFNPGKGAEADLTVLLTSTDADAEGEIESRRSTITRSKPAPPQDADEPMSSIETSSSSNPAMLAPAGGVNSKSVGVASSPQPSRDIETPEDDPIADFDGESLELQCGQPQQQVEQAGDPIFTEEEQSQQQQQQQIKKAPYVPNFSKGKGKATTNGTSPFQRASSAKIMNVPIPEQTSIDMDEDDDEPEPETIIETPPAAALAAAAATASTFKSSSSYRPLTPVTRSPSKASTTPKSNGKRSAEEAAQLEIAEAEAQIGVTTRSKRTRRCAEAAALEV
ncbi:HORMA domain-domain-containing protein [Leucosporidium creatinivorum]|uniref:HORMA domain-domain-containing protein n=1 Tax=Leucosporidium creatinivorum TaxID=106004 RepID=A0A1Y2DHF4_9BASI|nr:HORMA domain-domain-containing protein [Leucosporidium creatinivorum]